MKDPHLHHYHLRPFSVLRNCGKWRSCLFWEETLKAKRRVGRCLVCLRLRLCVKCTSYKADFLSPCSVLQSGKHTRRRAHARKPCDLCLHPQWTIFILDTETDTRMHINSHSILQRCLWKKNMDAHSTQTATHTHLQCAHTSPAQILTLLHREVNRRVWHPLASCASNAAEKQLNKLWPWQL